MSAASGPEFTVLLSRARQGEPEAMGQLVASYHSYVHLLARLQIDRRLQGKVSASDLVQETFLRVSRYISRFGGDTEQQLLAWLRQNLAAAMARMVRHYTTQRRDVEMERQLRQAFDQSSEALGRVVPMELSSPSEKAARRESAVLLADALAKLEPDYREAVVLRHLENLTFPEIAQRMGRTVNSVKHLWTRGLAKLRRTLGDIE